MGRSDPCAIARKLRILIAWVLLACVPLPAASAADPWIEQLLRTGDYAAAARQLTTAAIEGDADSQYQLASLYRSGRGITQAEFRCLQVDAVGGKAGARPCCVHAR